MKKTKKIALSKKDLPNNALFLHSWPIYNRIIHAHETDKNGLVHFSNYFKIAEEALYLGLKRLEVSFDDFDYTLAMVNTLADYYQPITIDDYINITIAKIKIQHDKLIFFLDFNDANRACLAKIQLTFILIDINNRKTMPVPEQLKAKLNRAIFNEKTFEATTTITTQIYT